MFRVLGALPADFADSAVAIGKFDGVHLGHQQLLHELVETAEELGLAATVLTFDRHPNFVLDPENVPKPLIGPSQRIDFFESLGIDALSILTFDKVLAELSPEVSVTSLKKPLPLPESEVLTES